MPPLRDDPPRLLVVGPNWVGDMVMAQSLFRILKEREPAPELHVLAPAYTRPLLDRMPEVDEALVMPLGHGDLGLGRRLTLGRTLRHWRYQQAILLPNSWKSALLPWWARIPRRTGWLGEQRWGLLNDVRRLDRTVLPMTVQRFVALGLPKGASLPDPLPPPRLRIDPDQARQTQQALGLDLAGRPLLALCPGAEYGPAKRWPAAYFGRLAAALHEVGWAIWLFGSERDREVCTAVNAAAGGVCTDLAGRTALGQALDLLSLAERVVSNDSGLMHVAAALDLPLVALFGSSDPGHTPPLSSRARSLSLGLACSPCFRRQCPLGHTDCLQNLPVQRVLDALAEAPA